MQCWEENYEDSFVLDCALETGAACASLCDGSDGGGNLARQVAARLGPIMQASGKLDALSVDDIQGAFARTQDSLRAAFEAGDETLGGSTSATCCVAAPVEGGSFAVQIANAGPTRGIVVYAADSDPGEPARWEDTDGEQSVVRSLGGFGQPGDSEVTPSVRGFACQRGDLILLASSGLLKVMDSGELADAVRDEVARGRAPVDLGEVARSVIGRGFQKGAEQNLTLVILQLVPAGEADTDASSFTEGNNFGFNAVTQAKAKEFESLVCGERTWIMPEPLAPSSQAQSQARPRRDSMDFLCPEDQRIVARVACAEAQDAVAQAAKAVQKAVEQYSRAMALAERASSSTEAEAGEGAPSAWYDEGLASSYARRTGHLQSMQAALEELRDDALPAPGHTPVASSEKLKARVFRGYGTSACLTVGAASAAPGDIPGRASAVAEAVSGRASLVKDKLSRFDSDMRLSQRMSTVSDLNISGKVTAMARGATSVTDPLATKATEAAGRVSDMASPLTHKATEVAERGKAALMSWWKKPETQRQEPILVEGQPPASPNAGTEQ